MIEALIAFAVLGVLVVMVVRGAKGVRPTNNEGGVGCDGSASWDGRSDGGIDGGGD